MRKTFLTLLFALFLCGSASAQEAKPTPPPSGSGFGTGVGNGTGIGDRTGNESEIPKPSVPTAGATAPLRILSKPLPAYTDAARQNAVEGIIRVRVAFLASGEIGSVEPLTDLPDALTEPTIEAARRIKFEPARKNGVPISTTKTVEYRFSMYFNENDPALAQNAEILEMPEPERPSDPSEIQRLGGKVKIIVELLPDGTTRAGALRVRTGPNPSKEFFEKIRAAVAKIKFNPAVHRNGNAVTQVKEIEYVFSDPEK